MDIKSGYMSSEFWISILGNIIGLLVITGIITPANGTEYTKELSIIIGAVINLITTLGYTASRTTIKINSIKAQNK